MHHNPFKAGDKVVVAFGEDLTDFGFRKGVVYEVGGTNGDRHSYFKGDKGTESFYNDRFRAAIAGQDYDVPQVQPSGHHSDGSGIQNHSCGELYPYVLVYRDKKHGRNAEGRYDVGVIGPRNQDPIWCKSFDHAVTLIETLKETKA